MLVESSLLNLPMIKHQTEMEAIVEREPAMMTVFNPVTLQEDPHYTYMAEIQYKRKPPAVRLIMCSSLDTVREGETVMITYHSGMRCYQHSRHVVTSNEDNCIGGFYFTDGTPAN